MTRQLVLILGLLERSSPGVKSPSIPPASTVRIKPSPRPSPPRNVRLPANSSSFSSAEEIVKPSIVKRSATQERSSDLNHLARRRVKLMSIAKKRPGYGPFIERENKSAGLLVVSSKLTPFFPSGASFSDRPPSPSPSFAQANSSLKRQKPKLGLGMRRFQIERVWSNAEMVDDEMPFAIEEIPSFERKSWTSLNTHRHKFLSPCHFPKTESKQDDCVVELKKQLLSHLRLSCWPVGQEPEITFPKIDGVMHAFVDIRYKTQKQHDVGRDPKPPLRIGCDPLTPWVHAAFVDEKNWWVVQVTHPDHTPNLQGWYSDKELKDMRDFCADLIRGLHDSRLKCVGKAIAGWLLPLGFPHSPDYIPSKGTVRRPEYIILFKRTLDQRLNIAQLKLQPYVEVVEFKLYDDDQDDEETWMNRMMQEDLEMSTWAKVRWEGRPDLCDYCKDALDGHLNNGCHKRPSRIQ
ncbi:uncharacterized protein UTRI_04721 [Ustilago trichophora]|uniref:Uncharacterized protein n=1 Tax=Ustilago trichophora TaxID=86804 RepID=A0A5C3ECC8_9BASI|nr:uncharacterized protein UTRI_04721 [Ustilago trichophora]